MSTATNISIATLTITAILITLHLRTWWRANKDPKILAPATGGLFVGSSLAICVGGVLGWIASAVAGNGNSVATVVPWATGAGDRSVAPGSASGLTAAGGLVVCVITALGCVAVREAAKKARWRLLGGVFVGVCLTYTAGVAGIVGDSLIPAYNQAGGQIVALVERAA